MKDEKRCAVPGCTEEAHRLWGMAGVRLCAHHHTAASAGHRAAREAAAAGEPFPFPLPADVIRWASRPLSD